MTPIERYAAWRREDGLLFDPWLRVHERLGAEVIGTAPEAMRIPGTVAEWEEWAGMAFPESGQLRGAARPRPGRDRPRARRGALPRALRLDATPARLGRKLTRSSSMRTRLSCSSEATASASSSESSREDSATSLSVRARRWRNEPSNGPCLRSGSKRGPRDGHSAASGHSPQRGTRAMQTVAPRSISACAHEWSKSRPCARARGARSRPLAGPAGRARSMRRRLPCSGRRLEARSGRRASRRGDLARRTVQVERAPVVAEPLPGADHVRRRRRGERLDGRPALEPSR